MRGFSLLEVLVATTIVAVGVVALAQLVALGGHLNRRARQTTAAAVLAQQKMEALLAAPAADLAPSPADALARDIDGWFDLHDGGFARRWSIAALPGSANGTVVLQVLVTDARLGGAASVRLVGARLGGAF